MGTSHLATSQETWWRGWQCSMVRSLSSSQASVLYLRWDCEKGHPGAPVGLHQLVHLCQQVLHGGLHHLGGLLGATACTFPGRLPVLWPGWQQALCAAGRAPQGVGVGAQLLGVPAPPALALEEPAFGQLPLPEHLMMCQVGT